MWLACMCIARVYLLFFSQGLGSDFGVTIRMENILLTYSNLFNVLLQYFCRGCERAFELVPEFDFSAVHHGSVHLFFFDLCAVLTWFVCLFVLFCMYAFISCCMSSFSLSLFLSALLRYCHVSFCLFVFLCHGFVILLLVFHIITSWTKEKKNYVSQRTSRSEKEDTSRKIRHLVAHGLLLSLAARERSGCASKPCAFIK